MRRLHGVELDNRNRQAHFDAVALGRALRDVRRRAGMTQGEWAGRTQLTSCKVDQGSLSRFERGERLPSLEELMTLEYVLDLPRGWILAEAGLLDVGQVEAAILSDTALDAEKRSFMLTAYAAAKSLPPQTERADERTG